MLAVIPKRLYRFNLWQDKAQWFKFFIGACGFRWTGWQVFGCRLYLVGHDIYFQGLPQGWY